MNTLSRRSVYVLNFHFFIFSFICLPDRFNFLSILEASVARLYFHSCHFLSFLLNYLQNNIVDLLRNARMLRITLNECDPKPVPPLLCIPTSSAMEEVELGNYIGKKNCKTLYGFMCLYVLFFFCQIWTSPY